MRRWGRLDPLVLLLLVGGGVWAWMHGVGGKGARAEAWVDGRRTAWWELSGPLRRDTLETAEGILVVEHGQGAVRIVQAGCPNHLCVLQGTVHRQGERLVCVPSRVVVTVTGSTEGEVFDAVQ